MSHSDRTSRSYGYIFNTKIDMNNNPIINLPFTEGEKDAVSNKKLSNIINVFNVILEDQPIKISNALFGSFFITINGLCEYQPNSSFFISKSNSKKNSYPSKVSCSKGEQDTYITIEWKANSGIYVFKNTNQYNGIYVVKIL